MSGKSEQITLFDFFYPARRKTYIEKIKNELQSNVYYNEASEYSMECQKQLLTEIENLYTGSQPLSEEFEDTILITDNYIKIAHHLVKIIELYNKIQVLNKLS